MNKKLFNVKLSFRFHHIRHDTTASMHQQVRCTRKKWYPGLTAYCEL